MTDYVSESRRGPLKAIARKFVTARAVNPWLVGALRRSNNAAWRSRIPVVGQIAELDLEGGRGSVKFCNTSRCQLAMEIFWNNGTLGHRRDQHALEAAVRLSSRAELFLDIGAYSGLFAIAVAYSNPSVQSHAYEIVPENYLCLWENVFENDLVERVHPRLTAVGDDDDLELVVPKSLGLGLLASSVALDTAGDGVRVPVRCIDTLYPDFAGRSVWKIDVEGFEWPVFRGAKDFMARVKPDIICEVLTRAANVQDMQQFLVGSGYRFFRITDNGMLPCENIVPVKAERDWLFTTKSDQELQAHSISIA